MKSKITLKVLIVTVILAGVWGFFIEPNMIKTEKISLQINNLPPSFNGVKILHLTDFHSKNFGKKEERVLKLVSELKPDFIFITGDIVDWKTQDFESCQKFWKALSKDYQGAGVQPSLKAKLPPRIFGVYGNHEHRNKHFENLDNLFKESEIKILNNETIKLEKKDSFIYLIGVDDPHLGYDDIEKAMRNLREDVPKILLAHSPEIFRKIKNKNINLVLTGHTHGCQINIPFLCDLIIPLRYDKKYKEGLFQENSTYLYVSRGIGETFLPVRFRSLPEITLINLTAGD